MFVHFVHAFAILIALPAITFFSLVYLNQIRLQHRASKHQQATDNDAHAISQYLHKNAEPLTSPVPTDKTVNVISHYQHTNVEPLTSPFEKCGDEAFPISIDLANCDDVECRFRRDTPVTVTIGFKTQLPAQRIKGTALAFVHGLRIPIPGGPEANICNNLVVGKCPMAAGTHGVYRVTASIPFFTPSKMRMVVRVRAIDELRRVISCFRISAYVEG